MQQIWLIWDQDLLDVMISKTYIIQCQHITEPLAALQ